MENDNIFLLSAFLVGLVLNILLAYYFCFRDKRLVGVNRSYSTGVSLMITLFSLVWSTLYGLDYETSWHGLRKLDRLGLITLYSAAFGFLNVEQFFMAAMYVSFSDKKSFLCPPVRIGRLIFVGVIILMSLSLVSVRHGFTKSLDVNIYMNYMSVIFTFFAIVANLSLVFFLSRDDCAQGDRGQSRRQATVTIVLNTFLLCSCVPIIAFFIQR